MHPSTVPSAVAASVEVACAALAEAVRERVDRPDPTSHPIPNPTIPGSDAKSAAAIAAAAAQLAALPSYQFSVDVVGREISGLASSSLDLGLRGTINRANGFAMDTLLGTRMRETNGTDASVSVSGRLVASDAFVWATDSTSGVLEPSPAESTLAGLSLVTPDGLASHVVVPFAGGYRRVGTEMHGGVMTLHFRASARGAAAYASALRFDGAIKADLWIASKGGHLLAAKISGIGGHVHVSTGVQIDDPLLIAFDVTKPGDPANVVELPVPPLADPVRPSGSPVNLQLEYRVVPASGTAATPRELDDIGVTLRYRLDVFSRPVKVEVVGRDRIVVTICNTTHGQADRRSIVAKGALTVVPLPSGEYGTTTHPGAKALPAVGGLIDPELRPIVSAARVGLSKAHVDPTNGRRGVAFLLGNLAAEMFRAHAAAHRGEYVAVVFDGVVLATLPIDDQVAQGHFAFTGDYTEAEARNLAQWLYRDPLPFELRPIRDVEIPAAAS